MPIPYFESPSKHGFNSIAQAPHVPIPFDELDNYGCMKGKERDTSRHITFPSGHHRIVAGYLSLHSTYVIHLA
jgi:hypothetical protein